MSVTPIGAVLILIGIISRFAFPRSLYLLTVVLVPFSATAVINVGTGESASGVPASLFFGVLWISTESNLLRRIWSKTSKLRKPAVYLGAFLTAVGLSLIVPIWSAGSVQIESPILTDRSVVPLEFSFKHITQTSYLAFGVVFALMIGVRCSNIQEFMSTIRVFMGSALFVAVWGIGQFMCALVGVTYPAYIFNTSATPSALGFSETVDVLGFQRISSVSTEPSIFAVCMLVALVIGLFATVSRRALLSPLWDRIAVSIIGLSLVMSTSTTAYLGLGLVIALFLISLIYVRIIAGRHLILLFLVGLLLFTSWAVVPQVRDLADVMLVNKGSTYSAIETVHGYLLAKDYFWSHPYLGLGWGSVTCRDLVLKLLSNTGLLGFVTFFAFLFHSFRALHRHARLQTPENASRRWCALCLFCALASILVLNAITGFEYAYAQLWFVIGLAIAVQAMQAGPPRVDSAEAVRVLA